jgi:hypothetical protein
MVDLAEISEQNKYILTQCGLQACCSVATSASTSASLSTGRASETALNISMPAKTDRSFMLALK